METRHESIVRVKFQHLCTHTSAAMPISPCILHLARRRFTLNRRALERYRYATAPSRLLAETTTQYLVLLNTTVRSLTSILPVIERPPPECAKLGERNLTIAPCDSKRPNTQHNNDYHTQHYLSPTHRSRSIVIDSTTTLIDPSTAVSSSSNRAVNSVPPTLVAERASAPLLLRTWLRSLTVQILNGFWRRQPKESGLIPR